MYYSIGQVSEMFSLSVSTLRYYDKMGLFPGMERVGGIRRFSERQLETIRIIECLKKSGLEIKDIKQFIDWCEQGPKSFEKRKELFVKQKENVEKEIERMQKVLDMLKFKCWYYEQAIKDGSDEEIRKLLPDKLPEDIQRAYDSAHKD